MLITHIAQVLRSHIRDTNKQNKAELFGSALFCNVLDTAFYTIIQSRLVLSGADGGIPQGRVVWCHLLSVRAWKCHLLSPKTGVCHTECDMAVT
jgi:hypothetical protein